MTASTVLVWDLAGRPDPQGAAAALLTDTPGVCQVCARSTDRTAPASRALGANFTDQGMYRAVSDRVCVACLWACSGKPPATIRMWSTVAVPDADLPESNPKAWLPPARGLYLGARGDTTGTLVASTLASPPDGPWHVHVALSGQKHVVPYADVNDGHGRWRVRMETVTVTGTPEEWAHVHRHALALRKLGVPADDVLAGTPRYLRTRAHLNEWRAHSEQISAYLRSPILDLALWTITKGHLQ